MSLGLRASNGVLRLAARLAALAIGTAGPVGHAQQGTNATAAGEAVTPFRIQVPDAVLTDLKDWLSRARFPGEIPGAGWDYGTDLAYLKDLVTYWRTRYDWRAEERRLNQFNQYTTVIDGLTVHFIHQRSSSPKALALAVTHGWPGSIAEFTKMIAPLTDPAAHGGTAADAFHVVAMSIPGFAFSGKPTERGYGPEKIAGVLTKLMARLGYTRYGVQGGDWGSPISRFAALNDQAHVVGFHTNFCLAGPPAGAANPLEGVPQAEVARQRAVASFMENERGYFQEQSTKPQTVGYGLDDSPVGLAAWIVEKFKTWSDSDGNVEKRFTKDELLTNVMLVEATNNLTRWTEMPRGGHFAALEEPDLLVDDIRAFFRTLR